MVSHEANLDLASTKSLEVITNDSNGMSYAINSTSKVNLNLFAPDIHNHDVESSSNLSSENKNSCDGNNSSKPDGLGLNKVLFS